jgi:glutamyl-tRNA reductase
MTLDLVGISHRYAPVALRERVAVDRHAAGRLSRELAADGAEVVCLSTCNRTELYVAHADAARGRALAEGPFVEAGLDPVVYRLRDEAAAQHLFRVAAGLESMVPGEGEILGQIRAAYEGGATGPLLHRLFRQAVHTGKKVRERTAIAECPASVSGAAAALIRQVFGGLEGRRILLVGAGKTSALTARNLVSGGATVEVVANRTFDRGRVLARGLGAEPLPLDGLGRELARADVVISSTSAPEYVVRRDDVAAALPARRGRPLVLVDLAVPRDLDPTIRELDSCYLYDLDDLEALVAGALAGRRCAAVEAEAIVAAEVASFRAWQGSLGVTPVIAGLRARAEQIRVAELARLDARLAGLSEAERRAVETVTAQILNKLLHLPTVRIKAAGETADGPLYAAAARYLFGLDQQEAREVSA